MDRFQLTIIDTALKDTNNKVTIQQLLTFWKMITEANLDNFEEYLYVKAIHNAMGRVKHDTYDAKRIVELSEKIGSYYTRGNLR